ncbi:hypothetical protein WAX74_12865 [Psychrobacillus sp. FJAT-51614]|uniref:DUF2642 domain-containing protein n=1 Tax=Psychrobacillus mangrovi TaxID=3117745 RepID=A0ABU8F690_9BACI
MEQEKDMDLFMRVQERTNDFCFPEECCPERFPSPQLPSPTDCLQQEAFLKVQEEIRNANELLMDLALADERPPEETFQKAFDGLIGLRVEITNLLGETIEGNVNIAGYDFVVLREEEKITILPYSQIETIKPYGRFAERYHDPELSEIDPCFRRELTFHFGEVVSSSPELIHLFFRIRLNVYLLKMIAKRIQVKIENSLVEGFLEDVNKDTIVLKVEEERNILPIDKILLITIKS